MPAQAPAPVIRAAVGSTRAAVLVTHGGKATSFEPSRQWHLSALRMIPFARSLHRELADEQVAVWSVRYRYRGWNGAEASPVADVRSALDRVRAEYGHVPVVLLGHSMGARAALRAGDDPSVRAVVALAPWLPPNEPVTVDGLVVHLAHGTVDRWTDPRGTRAWAERARPRAAALTYTDVAGAGHFMVGRTATWNRIAREGILDGLRPDLRPDLRPELRPELRPDRTGTDRCDGGAR